MLTPALVLTVAKALPEKAFRCTVTCCPLISGKPVTSVTRAAFSLTARRGASPLAEREPERIIIPAFSFSTAADRMPANAWLPYVLHFSPVAFSTRVAPYFPIYSSAPSGQLPLKNHLAD